MSVVTENKFKDQTTSELISRAIFLSDMISTAMGRVDWRSFSEMENFNRNKSSLYEIADELKTRNQ